MEKRRLSWPEAFLLSVFLTLATTANLFVWAMHSLDRDIPSLMSLQILANRMTGLNNQRASIENTYLIGMEKELRNIHMMLGRKELDDAATRLEKLMNQGIDRLDRKYGQGGR